MCTGGIAGNIAYNIDVPVSKPVLLKVEVRPHPPLGVLGVSLKHLSQKRPLWLLAVVAARMYLLIG